MKSIKKILTLMLAVMLIATSMAMPVMAEDEPVVLINDKPTLSTSATEYAVSGKIINLGNDINDALVLVAVYDGDALVSANFEAMTIANGENAINIAADVTGKTIASPKAKLFVWDATNYTPYLSVVEY